MSRQKKKNLLYRNSGYVLCARLRLKLQIICKESGFDMFNLWFEFISS